MRRLRPRGPDRRGEPRGIRHSASPGAAAAVLALLLACLPGAVAPAALLAQGIAFDGPSASGSFGEPIVFETTFTAEEAPRRVELLTAMPGEDAHVVTIAALAVQGAGRYQARVVQAGHVVPNTTFEYRFRALTDEGAVLGPPASHRVVDERIEWQVLEGELVDVWWHAGDESFARRAQGIAEEAMRSAGELLGVEDIEPVDFIIYADGRAFRQAMGPATRENVGGQAHPGIRTLFGLIAPRQVGSDWVEELVVHELAHLVFDEAVRNPYRYPPRWLNEGLAVYLSAGYSEADRSRVEAAARSGQIIPLEGLGGQFPTRPARFGLAYAESVSAVDFFVETYGEDRLVELITSFAGGIELDEAFRTATGEDFRAFDDAWLASVGAARPEALGPRPGVPGWVPDDRGTAPDPLLR